MQKLHLLTFLEDERPDLSSVLRQYVQSTYNLEKPLGGRYII